MTATVKAAKAKGRQPAFSEQSPKRRNYDYLSAPEIEALEAAAKKNRHGERDWLSIRMAFRHGLRASEVARIEWQDIDLDRGTIMVRRSKGGVDRTQYLEGKVMTALRALKRKQTLGNRFVFLSERGGPWAAVSFSRMVERLGDAVLPDRGVHAHQLRHSCGHHLAAKGIDTRRIQDQL